MDTTQWPIANRSPTVPMSPGDLVQSSRGRDACALYLGHARGPPSGPVDLRLVLVLILAISLAALAMALIGQFAFGLEPCILCLYERVPWAAAAAVAAIGLLGWAGRSALPVALCAVVFAAGAALAFYHVGVEEHWWASITGCGGGPVSGITLDDLSPTALASSSRKPCDRVDWRVFGLSLAALNAIASTLASLACVGALFAFVRSPAP